MPALPEVVYSLSEPKVPGYEVLGCSQQLYDDGWGTDIQILDQPLWYLRRRRGRRARRGRMRHGGRMGKR